MSLWMRVWSGIGVALIAVLVAMPGEAVVSGAETPRVLLLESNTPQRIELEDGEFSSMQIMKREMVRQALLIAARHDLGLATRDGTLHEPLELKDPAAGLRLQLHMLERSHAWMRTTIRNEAGVVVLEFEMPFERRGGRHYENVVTWMEPWSREHASALLREIGFQGEPHGWEDDGPALPEALEALGQINFFSQYHALRLTHRQIAEHGESLDRLSVLIRAYGNLGQLTRFHWNSSFRAYRARALMYAQRVVNRYPEDPHSYWLSAYAWMMFGQHDIALQRLEKAAELAGESLPPIWAALMEHVLHFRTQPLMDVAHAGREDAQLAAFLAFLTVELNGAGSVLLETGKTLLSANPQCYRVVDTMIDEAGVRYNHRLTMHGLQMLGAAAPQHLRAMEGVPPSVSAFVLFGGRGWDAIPLSRVAGLLVDDALESTEPDPSWAMLGRLIQETQYRQIQQRLAFMAHQWNVSVDETLAQLCPAVADHRFVAVLDSYAYSWARDREMMVKLFDEMVVPEPHYWMGGMYRQIRPLVMEKHERLGKFYDDQWWNSDATYDELAKRIHTHRAEHRLRYARWMREISPHAPIQISTFIRDDWENVQDKIDGWRQTYGHFPSVQSALARKLQDDGRDEEAIEMWERYLQHAHDTNAYGWLAGLYRKRGDHDMWLQTLHRILDGEDYGLSHARTRVVIATNLAADGKPRLGLPYAEDAAQSWAGWAMNAAGYLNDLLGDYERAELWLRRTSERYESSSANWIKWCLRTGKGDVDAARAHFDKYLQSVRGRETYSDWSDMAFVHYMEGRDAQAMEAFARMARIDQNEPFNAIHWAMMADRLNDPDTRDAALLQAAQGSERGRGGEERVPLRQMAQYLHETLRQDGVELNSTRLDEFVDAADLDQQINLNFLAGMFLMQRGQEEEGVERLLRATQLRGEVLRYNLQTMKNDYALARYELLKRGIGPEHFVYDPENNRQGAH